MRTVSGKTGGPAQQNRPALTLRASLMTAIGIFTLMLVIGAALGMAMLARANDGAAVAQAIAADSRDFNDVYKDAARTRVALMRVYTDVKEGGKEPSASANLPTAEKYAQRGQRALDVLLDSAGAAGADVALRGELATATRTLYQSLGQAIAAVRANDIATLSRINQQKLTSEGAVVSALLERFQQHGTEYTRWLTAQRDSEYRMVKAAVAAGAVLALALVVTVLVVLQRAVLAPLDHAVAILERVARGDLTCAVPPAGRSEVGRLMAGIRHMQGSLFKTVAHVRSGTDAIERVAAQVASGNADLSGRTEAQASSLQQTAASMEQLTGTVQQTADNARRARELVEAASATALSSATVMGKMVFTMADIDMAARKVADITAVIDLIAFQTNILALNAAVEAARAGAQGRGFAVVASEVRTLAQRSAVAAKDIKRLIDDSVSKVRDGGILAGQARSAMSSLSASVRSVAGLVEEIAAASAEQSQGITQVNQAIAQLDSVTQSNAALVGQAAAATQAMRNETARLIDAVRVFKVAGAGQ